MSEKESETIEQIDKEVPRKTEYYELTEHAYIRIKERNIETERVLDTIKNGHIQEAKGGFPNVRFIENTLQRPKVSLISNINDGMIRTVFWNNGYYEVD